MLTQLSPRKAKWQKRVATFRGTPTKELRALNNAALLARYRQLRRSLALPHETPARLRAVQTPEDAFRSAVRLNEAGRIKQIAEARGLTLDPPQAETPKPPSRNPFDIQVGDTVDAEYRHPDTSNIERGTGVVRRTDNGKHGVIYFVFVNGQEVPLSIYNLTRRESA